MITTQNIKEYCKRTGKKFEEEFACSYGMSGFGNNSHTNQLMVKSQDYMIGVEMSDLVWYWWSSYEIDGHDGKNLDFKQRYSQRTGQKASGVMTGMRAKMKIKKGIRDESLKLELSYIDGTRQTKWYELHWSDDKIRFRSDHYAPERTEEYLQTLHSSTRSDKILLKDVYDFLEHHFEQIVEDTKKYRNDELEDNKFLAPIYTKGE